MKIIITGSLGHISKPLTKILLEKGHNITVISRDADKQAAIEDMGAVAAIGSLQDVSFLSNVFAGADAVYTMVPPISSMDTKLEPIGHFSTLGKIYTTAIEQADVRRVVNLSSWGAHRDEDYYKNRPVLGKIKISSFAKDFVLAYQKQVS